MSWFRRLSIGKLGSPKKNSSCTTIPSSENNNDPSDLKDVTTSDNCPLEFETAPSDRVVEIVDPDEFFDDPHHVRMYHDERDFLDMISEWVIIENPKNPTQEENFFSADFEAELINIKRSESTMSTIEEDQFKIYEKNCPMQQSCGNPGKKSKDHDCNYKIFWGHRIETGSFLDISNSDDEQKHKTGDKASNLKMGNSSIGKKSRKKSRAYKRSIMSAIKDLPTVMVANIECTHDHDHDNEQDVEELFGLDDNGSIVLNMSHVVEEKGYGFLMCRTRKLYRSIKTGKEIRESYLIRKSVIDFLKVFCKCLRNFLRGHPRNKSQTGGPEDSVRAYTLHLANDHSSTFSRNIENFIACTKESREAAPQVVMRNMRQFMSGMKNYLVKHGEGDFQQEVLKARSRLKSDEFLNLDAILEAVMHQLVVLPLREHLYGMFVDYYTRSGDIQLLVENVKYACARSSPEFGIRPSVAPPTSLALTHISVLLLKLQEAELPLEKLELFLCIISSIFDASGCQRGQQLGADDFLPILVYVVAKCGFVGAEIEAEFMWGLLQPALLSGEAGYYLTALCSAVHVLKSFMASDNDGTGSLDWRSSTQPACSSVLRVIIPDECNGSLQTRTLPVRPHTTTRDVCRIIAHKARITNPQDYGLFKLVDGEETLLVENECPQDARIAARGKHCMLAYKRIDAKIAWPTATATAFQ